jgi:hypothetical protein
MIHPSGGRPRLELTAQSQGLIAHSITASETPRTSSAAAGTPRVRSLLVEPTDRVLLQRGFVPFEPRKLIYSASIGSPAGVHYAYDFESGALLRAWRGSFVDTFEMWEGRGQNQLAKPAGPALTFNDRPVVAWLEFARNGNWPDRPEALWSSKGYTLEADGQPVFLASLADLKIRDRIAPSADGRGLTRRLEFNGNLPSWSVWVLLAEADRITSQPGDRGWIIGDREWYLDWPVEAGTPAVVRASHGRMQLAVPLTRATLEKPITYTVTW